MRHTIKKDPSVKYTRRQKRHTPSWNFTVRSLRSSLRSDRALGFGKHDLILGLGSEDFTFISGSRSFVSSSSPSSKAATLGLATDVAVGNGTGALVIVVDLPEILGTGKATPPIRESLRPPANRAVGDEGGSRSA